MPEVERAGGAHLEGVSRGGDVIDVQFGATMNQALHGFRFELAQGRGLALDLLKEMSIANASHLDGFDVAGAFVPRGKRRQQFEIVDHRPRHREGADEVLFPKRVHPVFDPHSRIGLAEGGGGDAHMAHAAMGGGGGQPHQVQQGASADCDHIRMAIDMVTIDLGLDLRDVEIRVLDPFPSFQNQRGTNQLDRGGMFAEPGLDLVHQRGLGLMQGFVHHHQRFRSRLVSRREHVLEQRVAKAEDVLGEVHPVRELGGDDALNRRHRRQPCASPVLSSSEKWAVGKAAARGSRVCHGLKGTW